MAIRVLLARYLLKRLGISHILRYFRDLGSSAGDTAINDRRIDYIFGPPKLQKIGRVEVLRNAAVGRMDHWPLLVEVGF